MMVCSECGSQSYRSQWDSTERVRKTFCMVCGTVLDRQGFDDD